MQLDTRLLLFKAELESVDDYETTDGPLGGVTTKNPLRAGGIYLLASLNQMVDILRLCKSLEENHRELLRETKAQYDNLSRQKKELEMLEKRKSILQPMKFLAIRRAEQAFLESTKELFVSTWTTSERLKRALLFSPTAKSVPVKSDSVRKGKRSVAGAVPQPTPEMNTPETLEAVLTAAKKLDTILASSGGPSGNTIPNLADLNGQTSTASAALGCDASSSGQSNISASFNSPGPSIRHINVNLNYNIVRTTGSSTTGLTINNDSFGTRGSVINRELQANNPPS